MFSYQQLKYFCSAYKTQSLARASSELFLTRQALGKSLASLEREIGGQLFDRGNDGVTPTALADALYPPAADLVERSESVFSRISHLAKNNRYTLRIGSTFSGIETTCPLLPIEFGEAYPNIDLEVIEQPDLLIEEQVRTGQIDGAFVIGPVASSSEIHAICVHREGTGILVRADSPLAQKDHVYIQDLADVPLLVVTTQFKVRRQLDEVFAAKGIEPAIRYTSADFPLLVKMCAMGKGVTFLPVSRRRQFETEGLVFVPHAPEEDPGWQIDFVRREGAGESYALLAFESYLAERVLGS